MKPRSPRPGKLRTQVLAGVLLITLGALAVFDVAAVVTLAVPAWQQPSGSADARDDQFEPAQPGPAGPVLGGSRKS